MNNMNENVGYIPKGFAEVNGPISNRSVRAKQEAIANPLNAKYVEATQTTPVVTEQPTVEEVAATPVETPPVAEAPLAPDVSIDSFSVEKPAPTPAVSGVALPTIEEQVPNVNSSNSDVQKVFDEVLVKLATIDEKDKTINELRSKVETYESAFKTIKSTLSSQQLEEPGEVYKKAA